jgi:hypothetical protein
MQHLNVLMGWKLSGGWKLRGFFTIVSYQWNRPDNRAGFDFAGPEVWF